MNQNNGNNQLNNEREDLNSRVKKYQTIGHSKRIFWNAKRRFRSI